MAINRRLEFLSELYDALQEHPREALELRQSLEESGIDVDSALAKARAKVSQHRKALRLRAAKEKLARLRAVVASWTDQGKQSVHVVREDLARALAGDAGAPAYQAYYRKLEDVSEEDLVSLEEDAGLLDFIDRVEEDVGE